MSRKKDKVIRDCCQHFLSSTGKRCANTAASYYMRTVLVQRFDKKTKRFMATQELWCLDCAINDPPADPTRLMDPEQLRKHREERALEMAEDKVPPGLTTRPPARFGPSPLANFVDAMFTKANQTAVSKFRSEKATSETELNVNKTKVMPLCVECGREPRAGRDEKYCRACKKVAKAKMKHDHYFQRVPAAGSFRTREAREATQETKFGVDR